MQIQPLEPQCPSGRESGTAKLRLLPPPGFDALRQHRSLRMVGMVRTRAGDPIPDARIDWWHPADTDSADPTHRAVTCGGGGFDVVAGDSDAHLRVVVRAEGYLPLEVRLVPLPGLPAIAPPVSRSGRAPLAVRPGDADQVECWCEFVLTPRPSLHSV